MTVIKSISGVRGTVGGSLADGFNPLTITHFVVGYARHIRLYESISRPTVVAGRDARLSGEMVQQVVIGTLLGVGCDVINIGLATTPITEMTVLGHCVNNGIIITTSYNPIQRNALRFPGSDGTFLNMDRGNEVLHLLEDHTVSFASVEDLGQIISIDSCLQKYIDATLTLPEVNMETIHKTGLMVTCDPINSVGIIALPPLSEALGVKGWKGVNDASDGESAHNPEPLSSHFVDFCGLVRIARADVGSLIDPDVDRLTIIDETDHPFSEEYALVSVADYLLGYHEGGNAVSNMSLTRALRDIIEQHGGSYTPAAVGEVNVVKYMRKTDAFIGSEGNGNIIYPRLHAGCDVLVGIVLLLTHLAKSDETVSQLRKRYPDYATCKRRVELPAGIDVTALFAALEREVASLKPLAEDGLKIDLGSSWMQVRPNSTELTVCIYTEAPMGGTVSALADGYVSLAE